MVISSYKKQVGLIIGLLIAQVGLFATPAQQTPISQKVSALCSTSLQYFANLSLARLNGKIKPFEIKSNDEIKNLIAQLTPEQCNAVKKSVQATLTIFYETLQSTSQNVSIDRSYLYEHGVIQLINKLPIVTKFGINELISNLEQAVSNQQPNWKRLHNCLAKKPAILNDLVQHLFNIEILAHDIFTPEQATTLKTAFEKEAHKWTEPEDERRWTNYGAKGWRALNWITKPIDKVGQLAPTIATYGSGFAGVVASSVGLTNVGAALSGFSQFMLGSGNMFAPFYLASFGLPLLKKFHAPIQFFVIKDCLQKIHILKEPLAAINKTLREQLSSQDQALLKNELQILAQCSEECDLNIPNTKYILDCLQQVIGSLDLACSIIIGGVQKTVVPCKVMPSSSNNLKNGLAALWMLSTKSNGGFYIQPQQDKETKRWSCEVFKNYISGTDESFPWFATQQLFANNFGFAINTTNCGITQVPVVKTDNNRFTAEETHQKNNNATVTKKITMFRVVAA